MIEGSRDCRDLYEEVSGKSRVLESGRTRGVPREEVLWEENLGSPGGPVRGFKEP